jgi:prephenate dehydrogenase
MMVDILLTNQYEVDRALGACIDQLQHLAQLIEDGDEARLRKELGYIQQTRKEMFP